MAEKGAEIRIEGALLEGSQQADATGKSGMVTIDLIREGFGNPKDKHYYSPEVLREAAKSFEGAQMYANHLSPELRQKLGALPRNIQDLMGRIRETEVVVENGVTIIRGTASISQKWLWDMVEHDPALLGVSINARGSSVRGQKDGREAKIVEAIHQVGSVDWVSKAGAGGKVFALMEAQAEEEGYEVESSGDDADADATTEGATAGTTTHHHHHHYNSEGAGRHKHRHTHTHPNAVQGESHRHSEVMEAVEAASGEPDKAGDPAAIVEHAHEQVHEDSMGPGDHLHVHHHHHEVFEGETHAHELVIAEGDEETDDSTAAGDTSTSSDTGDAASTTPADTDTGDDKTPKPAEAAAADVAADSVFHHYNHHDSMGRGKHNHHHHHKTVAGETHEHVMDSPASTASRAGSYDDPARAGEHNHHHHHNSMGAGRHIHHHSHNLVPGEAHLHSVEPLVEADGDDAGPDEIFIDEANWIAGAIQHKGALHKDLGIAEGEKIPVSKLEEEAKKPGKIGKRARLALMLMKVRKGKGKKAKPAFATEADGDDFDWDLAEADVDDEVDRRANELAEAKLREGITAAVEMTRGDFDKKLKEALAEKDFEWGRKFGQLEQRHVAAAVIEAAELPAATERKLKVEFHDAFYEDKRDGSDKVVKTGESLLREAVKGAIKKKKDELRQFSESSISESGETADSLATGGERPRRSKEEMPKQAPLDKKVDEALAIPAGGDTD